MAFQNMLLPFFDYVASDMKHKFVCICAYKTAAAVVTITPQLSLAQLLVNDLLFISSYFYRRAKGRARVAGQLMKAPYIFSLLSPIVFKTAISFAFMTAAKSKERRGDARGATDIFCHPTVSSFLLNRTLKDHCITYSKITKSSRFMLTLRPELYAKLLMVYYEGSDGW